MRVITHCFSFSSNIDFFFLNMEYIHIWSWKGTISCEYLKYQNKMNLHLNKDDLKTIPCVHGVRTTQNFTSVWLKGLRQSWISYMFFEKSYTHLLIFSQEMQLLPNVFYFLLRDTFKSRCPKKPAPLYDSSCTAARLHHSL